METGQIPKTEEEKKKLLSELFRLLVGRACDDTFTESYRLYSQIKEELDKNDTLRHNIHSDCRRNMDLGRARDILIMPLYSASPLWFSSGLQYVPEIQAMNELNIACGISLNHASDALFKYLTEHHSSVKGLFIDSGAFSETAKKPFTYEAWVSKLAKYEALVKVYMRRCVFVVSDKIGDQIETIKRWDTHQQKLNELQKHSYMIVPLQKGNLSQSEMWDCAKSIWGCDIVAGIPFKKSATTYAEYTAFMKESLPKRVHILGVTPFGTRWRTINKLNRQFNQTHFTFDGCRIRSLIGTGRPFTEGMRLRKHLPRQEAIYETLISLSTYFTPPLLVRPFEGLPLFQEIDNDK